MNIREGAGEESELAGKLPRDAGCEILSQDGEWFQIRSGDVTGYVKGEYLLTVQRFSIKFVFIYSNLCRTVTRLNRLFCFLGVIFQNGKCDICGGLVKDTDREPSVPSEPETICGYTNLGIANVENHLNIREGAGEESELAGKLPRDAG